MEQQSNPNKVFSELIGYFVAKNRVIQKTNIRIAADWHIDRNIPILPIDKESYVAKYLEAKNYVKPEYAPLTYFQSAVLSLWRGGQTI